MLMLLTRMSSSRDAAITAFAPSRTARSPGTGSKRPLGTAAFAFAMAASVDSLVRPLMSTVAPMPASPTAVAKPMPRLEPVTSARFPVRSRFMAMSFSWWSCWLMVRIGRRAPGLGDLVAGDARQPGHQVGEQDQDGDAGDLGDEERRDALEDGPHRDGLGDAEQDEHVDADRRRDQPDLDDDDHENAPPYGAVAHAQDQRHDEGQGDHQRGQAVEDAAQHEVHDHKHEDDQQGMQLQGGNVANHGLRRLRRGDEAGEDRGAHDD